MCSGSARCGRVSSLRELDPRIVPYAERLVALGAPYGVKVTSVYRSPSKQRELYANRGKNPFPVARPGTSYHEYRRAWDMVGPPWVLERLGAIWESWGGTWGGRPHIAGHRADPIHFQV